MNVIPGLRPGRSGGALGELEEVLTPLEDRLELLVEQTAGASWKVHRSQGREPPESVTCPPKADISGDLAASSS
jgi:hypothetical protein